VGLGTRVCADFPEIRSENSALAQNDRAIKKVYSIPDRQHVTDQFLKWLKSAEIEYSSQVPCFSSPSSQKRADPRIAANQEQQNRKRWFQTKPSDA
jgi:hypothetical protein